jgi:hypothetical protein
MTEKITVPHRSDFSPTAAGAFTHQVITYLQSLGKLAVDAEETDLDFTDITMLLGSANSAIGSLRAEIEELRKEVRDNRSLAL